MCMAQTKQIMVNVAQYVNKGKNPNKDTVYLSVLVKEFIPEQNTTQTINLIHG